MANPEHLAILKQGVEVWSKWRRENEHIRIDLTLIDCRGKNLRGANFSAVDMRWANLESADMRATNLNYANMAGANCQFTALHGSILSRADLSAADLTDADLSGTDLTGADLYGALVEGTNFYEATLGNTGLGNLRVLRNAALASRQVFLVFCSSSNRFSFEAMAG